MTKSTHLALAGALLLSLGSGALAAGGFDGDNNPVPGASAGQAWNAYAAQPAPRFHSAIRNEARAPRAVQFSGGDPDPNVRLQLLRDAQDGEE